MNATQVDMIATGPHWTTAEGFANTADNLVYRPERFGDGTTTRNLQLDPLANMPQWQKQLLSNSFGHVRRDEGTIESERRSELLERKRKLAEELSRRRRSTVKSKRTDDKDAQQ